MPMCLLINFSYWINAVKLSSKTEHKRTYDKLMQVLFTKDNGIHVRRVNDWVTKRSWHVRIRKSCKNESFSLCYVASGSIILYFCQTWGLWVSTEFQTYAPQFSKGPSKFGSQTTNFVQHCQNWKSVKTETSKIFKIIPITWSALIIADLVQSTLVPSEQKPFLSGTDTWTRAVSSLCLPLANNCGMSDKNIGVKSARPQNCLVQYK